MVRSNGRRQRRAGTMQAKQQDADLRVRCTPRLGVAQWLLYSRAAANVP